VWFDHLLRYPTPAKATVSFAFDDGFATTVTSGKPALDKYGYRGTVFLMPTAVNTAGYLTQAQVDLLAQAGWDIGGHNVTDLTTLTFAQAEADVAATKAYLVDHGYKGGDAYAYPLGGHTFALRAMVAKYFNAARATSIFGQTRGYMARRNMMGRQLGPATAQAWITQAVGANEWLIITAHAIRTPTSTAEDYTPTNFAAVVDAVAASGAQVLPVSEALAVVG
jgi:peptidoglycan/xylan/chitin deacetylase (PgdA/CDA1 family)